MRVMFVEEECRRLQAHKKLVHDWQVQMVEWMEQQLEKLRDVDTSASQEFQQTKRELDATRNQISMQVQECMRLHGLLSQQ